MKQRRRDLLPQDAARLPTQNHDHGPVAIQSERKSWICNARHLYYRCMGGGSSQCYSDQAGSGAVCRSHRSGSTHRPSQEPGAGNDQFQCFKRVHLPHGRPFAQREECFRLNRVENFQTCYPIAWAEHRLAVECGNTVLRHTLWTDRAIGWSCFSREYKGCWEWFWFMVDQKGQ